MYTETDKINPGEPLLTLDKLSYRYPAQQSEKQIIDQISFSIQRGDYISIMGRNGSGKTTLLRLIAGHLQPSGGCIVRHVEPVNIVYLNQHASEFVAAALTVREQLLVGIGNRRGAFSTKTNDAILEELLHILSDYNVSLLEKLDSFTSDLSGGQRQIVALVAALAAQADILLLDEYTSYMDSVSVSISHELISKCLCDERIAIVIVEHQHSPKVKNMQSKIFSLGV